MSPQSTNNNDMLFAPEEEEPSIPQGAELQPWKVLIVDDDPSIHDITILALSEFDFDGRKLEFHSVYSGEEGKKILEENDDFVLALVDVVMEHEHAGLDLVHYIRNTIQNRIIRLILRTGQPGQAPERDIIRNYDINDYKEKSELSIQKLYSAVYTGLRSYRDLAAINANRRGLEHVIRASGELFQKRGIKEFIQGVLEQLVALLYLDADSMYVNCDTIAFERHQGAISVVAGTGNFEQYINNTDEQNLPDEVMSILEEVIKTKQPIIRDNTYVGYFRPSQGQEDIIYLRTSKALSDDDVSLIKLFLHNVSIAYENNLLQEEIECTQRDMLYMLGEAIESHSQETGHHVRRVSEYCHIIALGVGLPEKQAEVLKIAAPMHDFGKIGIPDHILHKPGKLDDQEWQVMKTHAEKGEELLNQSNREILQAAAKISGQHHEKWDGTGYPKGLKGEDIHIYGRIGAVADVFDALGSRRSYKEPWPLEKISDFLRDESGKHFDPTIIDWVLDNLDAMVAVRNQFPDPND